MAGYRAGQPVTRISAGLLNDAAALVERAKRAGVDFGAIEPPPGQDRNIIRVQNFTGAPRQRYDVVGLGAPVIKRGDNSQEFFARVVMRAVAPDVDRSLAVLIEPLGSLGIGRAVVAGPVYALAKINAESDRAVAVLPNEYRFQTSSGGDRTLWIEPENEREEQGQGWVVALLGSGGSSLFQFVKVRKDGGADGDSISPCTLTYSIWALGSEPGSDPPLATAVTYLRRTSVGRYVAAPDDSRALAYSETVDEETTWYLWDVPQEQPAVGLCGG